MLIACQRKSVVNMVVNMIKLDVNMVDLEESEFTRLHKEERIGSGWKHSRQKSPRETVVG